MLMRTKVGATLGPATGDIQAQDEIIEASNVMMIVRGDLGVEIGDAWLPGVQKRIVRLVRRMDKVVITVIQMMESMVHSLMPTRAGFLGVANAVIDGTDTVMLSAETAVGSYPGNAVAAMSCICIEAQRPLDTLQPQASSRFARIDEANSRASIYFAKYADAKAIAALLDHQALQASDLAIIRKGDLKDISDGTHARKLIRAGATKNS